MFALMLLKHYTKLSDEKFVDSLNADAVFQLFCGIKSDLFLQPIKEKTLFTRVRKFLSINLELNNLQKND
jgi:hypothetical protein